MEDKIIDIINNNSPELAVEFILELTTEWNDVDEVEPPHGIELLAKSPNGNIHLTSWRPAYDIFSCQTKSEPSYMWKWKLIN